jgi:protein SCO1/2
MMQRKYSMWVFVALVVIVPFVAFGIISWYQSNMQKLPVYKNENDQQISFNMINQKGEMITNKNWDEKIVVVNFFFTHCPVICPKMMRNLEQVQKSFSNDDEVMINSFSVDPGRDSVQRLLTYAAQMGIKTDNWNLLTGDKKDIYRLARKSFLVVATDGDGGETDFIHSDKVILLDTKKRIRGFYDGTNTAEMTQLIKDIKKLKEEKIG